MVLLQINANRKLMSWPGPGGSVGNCACPLQWRLMLVANYRLSQLNFMINLVPQLICCFVSTSLFQNLNSNLCVYCCHRHQGVDDWESVQILVENQGTQLLELQLLFQLTFYIVSETYRVRFFKPESTGKARDQLRFQIYHKSPPLKDMLSGMRTCS